MALSIRPLHPTLAAEISGVDLRDADEELAADLVAANDRYPVLVFRDQEFDDESEERFGLLFGLSGDPGGKVAGSRPNLGGQRAIGTELWHTDSSHQTVPAK